MHSVSTPDNADPREVWEFPIPGGLVLAVPDFDGLFFLNPSAAFIWFEYRRNRGSHEIATRLARSFDIPFDVALRDVAATVAYWLTTPLAQGAARFDYHLNGSHFRLFFSSAALEAEIVPRLAHLAIAPARPDFTIRVGMEESVSEARALLLQEMVRLSRGSCRWLALLHAGACANDQSCIVFPGPSGSGKSTLAAVLMQSGLRCHADDTVAIENETLLIPAMPFALAIRAGSWPVLAERVAGFDTLPQSTRFGQPVRFLPPTLQSEAVPAAALVVPQYDPGAETFITTLEPLETLIHLRESGFWVENNPRAIEKFLQWVQSLPRYRVVYSDVNEVVSFFARLLTDSGSIR